VFQLALRLLPDIESPFERQISVGGKAEMGMRELAEPIDTYGLPVYKTTKIIKERVGDEIHMLCGHEMFGRIMWTHIAIMSTTDVLTESRECQEIATRPFKHLLGVGH
jgi:hypothetical protein